MLRTKVSAKSIKLSNCQNKRRFGIMLILVMMLCIVNKAHAEVFPRTPEPCRQSGLGVSSFKVFDGVNNVVSMPLDNEPPTVSQPTYSEGNYTISIESHKSQATQDYPIIGEVYLWKVVDSNGQEVLPAKTKSTTIIRPSHNAATVTVYDHANNATSVQTTSSVPKIASAKKTTNGKQVRLDVLDDEIDLWKVTNETGDETLANLSNKRCMVTFELNSASNRKIRIYNHAGNYTLVDLALYEFNNFGDIKTYRRTRNGETTIKVFDGVNNVRIVPMDDEPPTVSTPRYSGNNYIINVHANKSEATKDYPTIGEVYLWKVVDGNGTYSFPGGTKTATVTRSSNNAGEITVYDKANNQTTITLEGIEPTISAPSYNQGNYTVTVEDPGESTGEGSGIWKIQDNSGVANIKAGVITRPKSNGAETIHVYDNAGNEGTLELTMSEPQIASLHKVTTETEITLDVFDSEIELWKVTNESGDTILSNLTGQRCKVTFNVPSVSDKKIRIYNHSGNYNLVDLSKYESKVFGKIKTYRVSASQYEDTGIRIYDGVGNYISYPSLDNTPPTVSSVWANATNTMFKLTATDEMGLGKIKDGAGNTLQRLTGISDSVNFETQEALTSFDVYDAAYNKVTISNISQDVTQPSIARVHGNDVTTIKATDEESGIWKITDAEGNIVLADYSDTFPQEVTYQSTTLNDTLRVYDGVGNYINVDLKREITEDATISSNELNGIKVTEDCTITFENDKGIYIGKENNNCAGIEVAEGVTLTIINLSEHNISVFGGSYTDSDNNIHNCAGIHVPSTSTLVIQGTGTINAYGSGESNGTGAGIGGNGMTIGVANASLDSTNAGTIIIEGGNVNAYGGSNPNETLYGLGAGIGGGGIYNTVATNVVGANASFVEISTPGLVTATGGTSDTVYGAGAGIGGGGIASTITLENPVAGGLGDIAIGNVTTMFKGQGTTSTYGEASDKGSGGIYNNGTSINGAEYVDNKAPVVSNVYKNTEGTICRIQANDNIGLAKITKSDGTLIKEISGMSYVTCFELDQDTTSFKVWDNTNNSVEVTDIPIDNTPPILESVTYVEGRRVVKIRDNESGLWKITNKDGTILADYSE